MLIFQYLQAIQQGFDSPRHYQEQTPEVSTLSGFCVGISTLSGFASFSLFFRLFPSFRVFLSKIQPKIQPRFEAIKKEGPKAPSKREIVYGHTILLVDLSCYFFIFIRCYPSADNSIPHGLLLPEAVVIIPFNEFKLRRMFHLLPPRPLRDPRCSPSSHCNR